MSNGNERALGKDEGAPEWRKCEFCGCNTNAKARGCCDAGRAADVALATCAFGTKEGLRCGNSLPCPDHPQSRVSNSAAQVSTDRKGANDKAHRASEVRPVGDALLAPHSSDGEAGSGDGREARCAASGIPAVQDMRGGAPGQDRPRDVEHVRGADVAAAPAEPGASATPLRESVAQRIAAVTRAKADENTREMEEAMTDPAPRFDALCDRVQEAGGMPAGMLTAGSAPLPPAQPAEPRRPAIVIRPPQEQLGKEGVGAAPAPNRLWFNGYDWLVASCEEEARRLLAATSGCSPEELDGDGWKEWPPEKPLTIHDDEGGEETRTGAEWAAQEPAGFLGSTEY